MIGEDTQISVQFKPKKTLFFDFASDSLITAMGHNIDWLEDLKVLDFPNLELQGIETRELPSLFWALV